jgi:hypothetical protein
MLFFISMSHWYLSTGPHPETFTFQAFKKSYCAKHQEQHYQNIIVRYLSRIANIILLSKASNILYTHQTQLPHSPNFYAGIIQKY